MTTYVIFRHGSNAYNQHMSESEAVGVVDAPNRASAVALAHEMPFEVAGCYLNQWLEARPASRFRAGFRQQVEEWMYLQLHCPFCGELREPGADHQGCEDSIAQDFAADANRAFDLLGGGARRTP